MGQPGAKPHDPRMDEFQPPPSGGSASESASRLSGCTAEVTWFVSAGLPAAESCGSAPSPCRHPSAKRAALCGFSPPTAPLALALPLVRN